MAFNDSQMWFARPEATTDSWWLGLTREQFAAQQRERQSTMSARFGAVPIFDRDPGLATPPRRKATHA